MHDLNHSLREVPSSSGVSDERSAMAPLNALRRQILQPKKWAPSDVRQTSSRLCDLQKPSMLKHVEARLLKTRSLPVPRSQYKLTMSPPLMQAD